MHRKALMDLCVKGEKKEAGGEKCIVNGERRKQWAEVRENYRDDDAHIAETVSGGCVSAYPLRFLSFFFFYRSRTFPSVGETASLHSAQATLVGMAQGDKQLVQHR